MSPNSVLHNFKSNIGLLQPLPERQAGLPVENCAHLETLASHSTYSQLYGLLTINFYLLQGVFDGGGFSSSEEMCETLPKEIRVVSKMSCSKK